LYASYTDIRTKEISSLSIIIFGILGLICSIFGTEISTVDIFFGVAIGLVFVGISILTRGEFGMGDALLICVMGLYFGFVKNIEIVLSAFFLSMCYSIVIFGAKRNLKYEFPFVPFLFISYIAVLIFAIERW